MKTFLYSGAHRLLLLSMAALCACDEEVSTTSYLLCDPAVVAVSPDSVEDATPVPASIAGSQLAIEGRYLWAYFSGTTSSCDETETGTAVEETPVDGTPVPYPQPYDLQVLVGGQPADITRAYEQSRPFVYQALDGTQTVSDCDTCRQCVTCNSYGCGGCEAACQGCAQVIDITVPALPPDAGHATESGEALTVAIVVFSEIGQTPEVYYDFAFVCADGLDNDDDGWLDLEDPGCADLSSGTSELDACADGVDNDGDDQIDLEDEACAGDPRGQSEDSTVAPAGCADGTDNDDDGWIDALDPDCTSAADDDESL